MLGLDDFKLAADLDNALMFLLGRAEKDAIESAEAEADREQWRKTARAGL